VGVAYSRNKLALRIRLRTLNLKSKFFIFDSIGGNSVYTYDFLKFVGVKASVSNIFLDQSIDKNNTFQFKFLF